jgi:CRISPR-associated protein Csb1
MRLNLPSGSRLLIEAALRPAQGSRFQPTGFPSLGPATYQLHDGTRMLLVESAQSMANRLEQVMIEPGTVGPVAMLTGLPYVEVRRGDEVITSSLVEAHRLNSPYILEAADDAFRVRLIDLLQVADESAIDERRLAAVLARFDPATLLHGVFLAKKEIAGGRFRLRRALSAFIEARDVETVMSGGVKNDHVNPSGEASAGFGNVPFTREEFTARTITAYFNLDLAQLAAYRLPDPLRQLLTALALWKVQRLLADGLRLRTACDLEVESIRVTRPEEYVLPSVTELESALPSLIAESRAAGVFADPLVTVVQWTAGGSARTVKGRRKAIAVVPESDGELGA